MKKTLAKLSYMALGSLLTFIGYHFGNIDSNSADAQEIVKEKPEIVDEIRCRRLVIVGDDDTHRIILGTDDLDRGSIQIFNEEGARRVFLGIMNGSDGGTLEVTGKEFGGLAGALGADDYGGFMSLYNKVSDNPVLDAAITSKGHGSIVVRDAVLEQIDVMGPLGTFTTKQKWRNQRRRTIIYESR